MLKNYHIACVGSEKIEQYSLIVSFGLPQVANIQKGPNLIRAIRCLSRLSQTMKKKRKLTPKNFKFTTLIKYENWESMFESCHKHIIQLLGPINPPNSYDRK